MKIIIFGNSGAGKSTLSFAYAKKYQLSLLDLDTLAWLATDPPSRKPLAESFKEIERFMSDNSQWVIEGGYADLIALPIKTATEIVFLNPGVNTCVENCKNRPWEPHKYDSESAQNDNLSMLLEWVAAYYNRTDTFSLPAHKKLFNDFKGKKTEHFQNTQLSD